MHAEVLLTHGWNLCALSFLVLRVHDALMHACSAVDMVWYVHEVQEFLVYSLWVDVN